MAWLTTGYHQGKGVQQIRTKFPITAGLIYNF